MSDDEFPDVDGESELAWSAGLGQLLLRTRHDLKVVQTFLGGQTITLQTPSPIGHSRFDVVALDEDRFMICYVDGVEVWGTKKLSSRPIVPRVILTARGYRIDRPVAGGKLVAVHTPTSTLLVNTEYGGVISLEPPTPGTFELVVDPTGVRYAFLKDWLEDEEAPGRAELWVRSLDRDDDLRLSHPQTDADVRGFAWARSGRRLALWTEDTCYVDDLDRLPSEVHTFEEGSQILDVQWLEDDALVVTTHSLASRLERVSLEEQQ
jgi:hypothetical protein